MTPPRDMFNDLQSALKQAGAAMGASELHGVLTAHAAKSGYDEFGAQLAINAWLDIESPSAELRQRVKTLAEATRCLLYTSPSPRDLSTSRMPSSA